MFTRNARTRTNKSGKERRSRACYVEFDPVLSVGNVVKLPQVCKVNLAEELAQSPPEYHTDGNTTYDFQENEFGETKENQKKKNT